MSGVVCFVDTLADGTLDVTAAELIGVAATLGPVTAVAIAPPSSAEELARELGRLGAGRVTVVEADGAQPAVAVPAVVAAAAGAAAVLAAHTVTGREVAGRAAVRLDAAVAIDVVGLRRDDDGVVAEHSVLGGAYLIESRADRGVMVATLRPGTGGERAASAEPDISIEKGAAERFGIRVEAVADAATAAAGPPLGSARRVVAGGRGLGSRQGFELAQQLADALGAAVGASRAAVDAGFAVQGSQIGQTGLTVSPELYVALGISGAIQHRVGMQTAGTIVAVNTDPDAPIFDIADIAVVGDCFEVVPQLIAALGGPEADAG